MPLTRLAVVAPCFNEMEVIEAFYGDLRAVLDGLRGYEWQIVFVDDGSDDSTLDKLNAMAAEEPRVKVYSLSRNFGHQIALSAGLDVVDADIVVMMDSDLQHPPGLIPQMLDRAAQGYDVVSAVRLQTEDATWFKRATARGFYWVINRVSEVPIAEGAADFCVLSRRAHQALQAMPERHRFVRGMLAWVGFRRAFVPFSAPARPAGRSKYDSIRMYALALDALFSFSAAPLRLASRAGLLLVALGIAYFGYVVVRYAAVGDLVRGWGSVISTVLIIGGAQLFFVGLIGEYLARIFEQVKRRPLYFFKQQPGDRQNS